MTEDTWNPLGWTPEQLARVDAIVADMNAAGIPATRDMVVRVSLPLAEAIRKMSDQIKRVNAFAETIMRPQYPWCSRRMYRTRRHSRPGRR